MTLRAAASVDQAGVGTTVTPYTPAASDTFAANDLPAYLRVANGSGGSINVTVTDGGRTALGTAAAALSAATVGAGVAKTFKLTSTLVNNSTGVVTVAFSATTDITCEFFK